MESFAMPYVQTLMHMLLNHARQFPDQRALLYRSTDGELAFYTFSELLESVQRLGTALLSRGLSGRNIAVIGKNSVSWVLTYFAVSCGVGVVVPVEREMDEESLANILRYASVRAVFADEKTLEKLRSIQKKLPKKLLLFSLEEEAEGFETCFDLMRAGEALIDGGDDSYIRRLIDPDAMAFLLFTSGTTGNAKGVMLSHRNLCSDIMSVARRMQLSPDDSTLCLLPLHHTYQAMALLTTLYAGGSAAFCKSLREMSKDLSFFRPTVITTVPLMLEKMHGKIMQQLSKQSGIKRSFATGKMSFLMQRFDWKDLRKFVYSAVYDEFGGRLRMIIVGAAPLNPDIAKDFASFGCPVIIGYGLTECSPIIMCNPPNSAFPDGVGKPLDTVQVILKDQDESGAGEICVKGPMVMLGYYKNKKATRQVLENGWLRTGDLGYCDENGNYHITGRSKNVIVTKGGKNIYPEEIEFYLNRDPLVLESLIFNDQNSAQEVVVAEVVPDEDAIREQLHKEDLTGEDIERAVSDAIKRTNRKLPAYKAIRRVFIRKEGLEKTGMQKVRREKPNEPPPEPTGKAPENTDK